MRALGSHSASWHFDMFGLPLALGVMWTPVPARHRRISPKPLAPRNRRSVSPLRRIWPNGQHAAPRAAALAPAAILAVVCG